MVLHLKNMKCRHDSWSTIILSIFSGTKDVVPSHSILETDQISFKLHTEGVYDSAKLVVENLELIGVPIGNNGDVFEWQPKRNTRFGYDALFLHYFGVAQLAVELTDEHGAIQIVVFEPIEIYGRKITADRAMAMLTYISGKVDEHILSALSPTIFSSALTKNGVAPAEVLSRLEKTIDDVEITIKNIIIRPLTSLRTNNVVLTNPSAGDIDDCGVEWITEYSGLSEQASCKNDGIFFNGMEWRGMPEVHVGKAIPSTDIYENHLVLFYLNKLVSEGRKILSKCERSRTAAKGRSSIANYSGYISFFDVSHKSLSSITAKYELRARTCVSRLERMIYSFNKKILVSPRRIGRPMLTEKIKSNRHYLLFIKSIKEWVECRDINWLEQKLLNSVHSTPILFEYYSVILTDSWLKKHGGSHRKGLFSGEIFGKNVKLYYEPSFPHPQYGDSKYGIWSCDINSRRGRRPDIVLDIENTIPEQRRLLIFDAKCRNEYDVINYSLPDCAMKYGYGLRDIRGHCPVDCVVMLHPKPINENDDFVDFYASPFNFEGATPARPILGAQRLNINNGGVEDGFNRLLNDLFI